MELEAEAFLARMQDLKLPDGRDRLVRHGHGPERMIQTGIGPVAVSRVKIRDRGAASDDDRVRFSSSILPKWARRTRSLDALLPILYLRGVSTGKLQEALAALLGRDAPNLSPSVIARLSGEWQAEYEHWQRRDLSARRYVYLWADGVYLQARMEEHAECMLVMIGATPEGGKELVGFQVGVRESTQSWRELLVEVKRRGLTIAPEIAVGDGALGFWKALDEIYPRTRHQRCWLHKTANVLNKVPRAVQATMKVALREIHGAETRSAAEAAIETFACDQKRQFDEFGHRRIRALRPRRAEHASSGTRSCHCRGEGEKKLTHAEVKGMIAAAPARRTVTARRVRVDHRYGSRSRSYCAFDDATLRHCRPILKQLVDGQMGPMTFAGDRGRARVRGRERSRPEWVIETVRRKSTVLTYDNYLRSRLNSVAAQRLYRYGPGRNQCVRRRRRCEPRLQLEAGDSARRSAAILGHPERSPPAQPQTPYRPA